MPHLNSTVAHRRSRETIHATWLLIVAVVVLSLIASGCSQKRLRSADLPLDDAAALQAMTPDDPGKAADFHALVADGYFFAGQPAEAAAAVEQSLDKVPGHGGAMYVKALLLESDGDWPAARDIYGSADTYARMDDALERRMRSRYAGASREIIRREMKAKSTGPDQILEPNALVIHQLQPMGNTRADTALAMGVTDYLTTSFAMIEGLTVIDRTRRSLLEDEIARSQNAAYDQSTKLVEQKIGAGLAMTGHIGTAPADDKRADADFVISDLVATPGSPEYRGTGRPLAVSTTKRHLLQDVGKEVVEVCETYLGMRLDEDVKERLARPPTESFKAFLAYADGLLLEDEGQFAGAFEQFNLAAQFDPGFTQAQAGADRVGGAGADGAATSVGDDLPPLPADSNLGDEALETAILQADEIPLERTQDPVQTTIVHTTVRIEIITHQR